MRLGGAVMKSYKSPSEWLSHVKELGYSCVVFPVNNEASKETIMDYYRCAMDNDLVIGEVGIWKNVFARDEKERAKAIDWSIRQLELAETVGANCCVNISGSKGIIWDSYHKDNFTKQTYDEIISMTQMIIDKVNPKKTKFTLEPMPWMIPTTPEEYLSLIRDINRSGFGVHLDYANMINGIDRYQNSNEFISKCFELLAPYILSVHAKDLLLDETHLPVMISEVLPGTGGIDLSHVLACADKVGKDITVFIEHLNNHDEYMTAAKHMRKMADKVGVYVK